MRYFDRNSAIIRAESEKEGRNPNMKEIMFEFATFLLATVQAATLMWIMAVFVP